MPLTLPSPHLADACCWLRDQVLMRDSCAWCLHSVRGNKKKKKTKKKIPLLFRRPSRQQWEVLWHRISGLQFFYLIFHCLKKRVYFCPCCFYVQNVFDFCTTPNKSRQSTSKLLGFLFLQSSCFHTDCCGKVGVKKKKGCATLNYKEWLLTHTHCLCSECEAFGHKLDFPNSHFFLFTD